MATEHGSLAHARGIPHATRLPRRQFLRAFVRWALSRRRDLPFDLKHTLRRDAYLTFSMVGINPALVLVVSQQELRIEIHHAGHFWDILTCFESQASHHADGYRCALCIDPHDAWPTRQALWADHCFEPFAEWMTQSLATAAWLDLYSHSATSWASLVPADATTAAPPEDLRHRLPIRA